MAPEQQSPAGRRLLTGLIGAPIAMSASPAMHEEAADALSVRCHYHLIEVAGADQAGLRALLDGVKRLGFAGVNVTFPYKEAVIPLLDELSPRARWSCRRGNRPPWPAGRSFAVAHRQWRCT